MLSIGHVVPEAWVLRASPAQTIGRIDRWGGPRQSIEIGRAFFLCQRDSHLSSLNEDGDRLFDCCLRCAGPTAGCRRRACCLVAIDPVLERSARFCQRLRDDVAESDVNETQRSDIRTRRLPQAELVELLHLLPDCRLKPPLMCDFLGV